MKKQHYMTYKERCQLEALLRAKIPVQKIAAQMGFNRATIYNEIKRGTYKHNYGYYDKWQYSADKGQDITRRRQQNKGGRLKIGNDIEYAQYLEQMVIENKYSPAAALAAARKEGFKTSICVNTFYSYIDKKIFLNLNNKHLWERRKRKKRKSRPQPRIINYLRPSIETRPSLIGARKEAGHYEMDLIISGGRDKTALLTLTDKMTRQPIIRQLPNKRAVTVQNELKKLRAEGHNFKSITTDNGSEFTRYAELRAAAGCEIYYCHSYSAWEKGQIENMNRMVRRFIPKGCRLQSTEQSRIQQIEQWIDNYPRKSLGWLSPREVRQKLNYTA